MSEPLKKCPICGKELKVYGPEDWTPTFYDPDSGGNPYNAVCDCGFSFCNASYEYEDFVKAVNRRAEPVNNTYELQDEPLTPDELKRMDGEPVWWWNKSAKPQLTICSFKKMDKTPNFISFDWDEQDCTEITNYQTLVKRGYKPYRGKPSSTI